MIDEIKFKKILSEVITNEDKIVVLYSGIWSFIKKINFNITNPKKIPEVILDIIEEKIGKDKTLFLPSFSGESFYKKKYFSIDADIDKKNGLLPITALKKGYFRTKQPIHSYLVFGNLKEVRKLKLKSSWGEKSLLEFFQKKMLVYVIWAFLGIRVVLIFTGLRKFIMFHGVITKFFQKK